MPGKLYYDQRDLFERYYPVRYRYHDSRSTENIRQFGVRSSGFSHIDQEALNYMVDSELTINQMFEFWRKGVGIRVTNYNDTAEIYDIIHRHLTTTAEYLRYSVNSSSKELLIDMVDLDKFASVVYDKAKTVFTDRERAAVHSHGFAGIQSINFFNILNGKDYSRVSEIKAGTNGKDVVVSKTDINHSKAPVREREDYSKVFIEYIDRLGGIGSQRDRAMANASKPLVIPPNPLSTEGENHGGS